jgi:hypothetical protein
LRKILISLTAAGLFVAPAQAADWKDRAAIVQPGTFVGARLTIGGRTGQRPRAALTIAPTQTRTSHDGFSSMRIGEGIAFNLTPGAKPTLTLAGVRADTVLGLHRNGSIDAGRKLGVSEGGWVAIGVGVVALAGGLYVLHLAEEADENSD